MDITDGNENNLLGPFYIATDLGVKVFCTQWTQ